MECPNCGEMWPDGFKVCPRCVVPLQAVINPTGEESREPGCEPEARSVHETGRV